MQALRLADPEKQGYIVRWPLMGSKFNARDYPSTAMIIDDIETILETTLESSFSVSRREYKVGNLFPSCHRRGRILSHIEGLLRGTGNT